MKMGRQRKGSNSDLPEFVYFNGHSYVYRHPVTGKVDGLGGDRATAVHRGHLLNHRIFGNDKRRLRELRNSHSSLGDMLDGFAKYRKERVGPVTYKGDKTRIEQYRKWFDKSPGLITIEDINKRLDGAGYDVIRQHRILLRQFFEYCRRRGAFPKDAKNTGELLDPPVKAPKQRVRLTLEWYWSIYKRASADLQTAMALSLITSMRRGDLVTLTAGQCEKPFIRYIPSKTKENPDPMPTACKISDSHWAKYVAPALLRAGKGRLIPRSPEWLTREFGDHSTEVTKLPPKTRPTLHEVRALSDDLYRKQGDDKDTIRQRNAHRSERTTDGYLSGHGIVYNEVKCELRLENAD